MTSSDLTETLADLEITPGRRLSGQVVAVFQTTRKSDFRTQRTECLDLALDGLAGDRHGGFSRRSGGREPWYPRGTEMCNERQISILCADELSVVAERMELDRVEPEWLGANVLLAGLTNLSLIPPRTRLVFNSGAVIRVDGDNAPCRAAGRAIAENFPEREGLDLLFPKVAKRLRGLVGYVEKAGKIATDDGVTAFIPEQWIYDPA
ncbi:MOSC domain-containing protein [Roseibium sp.]|uniref:MOSC domain-containing protein n=1 Tax=Roseibium sp. TaxID=1936156 RepID=UPI003A980C9D